MPDTPLLPTFIMDFVSNASSEQRRALISLLGEYEGLRGDHTLLQMKIHALILKQKPSHPNEPAISKTTKEISQHVVSCEAAPYEFGFIRRCSQ